MKQLKRFWRKHRVYVAFIILALGFLAWLLLRKLGSLTGGLSAGEMASAASPVGWHGIYHAPLDLPLKLLRSVVFWASPDHGQILTRLPNALFGALSVITFGWLIWLWHGPRTAIFTTMLFATSAWTLHVSRLASNDVLYLWAVPTLLLIYVLLHREGQRAVVWYGSLLIWGLLLYVPGLVWLILIQVFLQKDLLIKAWRQFVSWQRKLLSALAILIWLPLLIYNFTRPGQLVTWLGLPAHFDSPLTIVKHFISVFVHLFIRGPHQPELWLGRVPLLDAFTLLCCGLGIYFYAKNRQASRSRALSVLFVVSVILVSLGGPVSLSLLVPLMYIAAAAGIAYLLHEWLKVFPLNPLARGLGIALMSTAIAVSCIYNLRAYFVAWPHNSTTQATFRYHR